PLNERLGSFVAAAAKVARDADQAAEDVVARALAAVDAPVADERVAGLVHNGPLLVQEDVAAHGHLGDEVEPVRGRAPDESGRVGPDAAEAGLEVRDDAMVSHPMVADQAGAADDDGASAGDDRDGLEFRERLETALQEAPIGARRI